MASRWVLVSCWLLASCSSSLTVDPGAPDAADAGVSPMDGGPIVRGDSGRLLADSGRRPADAGGVMAEDASMSASDGAFGGDASPSGVTDDVRRGVFDPSNVYLAGTVSEGACAADAIVDYVAPDQAAAGFDCRFVEREATIAPDGVLTYHNTYEDLLRRFSCDDCPGWTPTAEYPSDVLANDTVLSTPPCDRVSSGLRFRFSPDGRRIHRCSPFEPWRDESGAEMLPNLHVHSYGWSGVILTEDALFDSTTGESSALSGLPDLLECPILTARSGRTTGFRLALGCDEAVELWSVDHSGNGFRVGSYPPPPAGYSPYGIPRLAGDGTLVQLARGPAPREHAIIERTILGRSELMYTEAWSPAVKIDNFSSLVTGP